MEWSGEWGDWKVWKGESLEGREAASGNWFDGDDDSEAEANVMTPLRALSILQARIMASVTFLSFCKF